MKELTIENQWICSSPMSRYVSQRDAHLTSEYSHFTSYVNTTSPGLSSASGVDWRGVPAPKLLPLPGGALGGSGKAAPPPGSSAPVYVDAREVAPAHCASDGWRSRAFADGVFADARPEVVAASCVPSFLKKEWDWKRRAADDSRVGVRRDFLGF